MAVVPDHPLHNVWAMWYDSKKTSASAQGNWEEGLVMVQNVGSVEEFWVMMNHIKRPGSLEVGANYHLFKQGVKPMWEDGANKDGGKWMVTITAREDLSRLDQLWEELLLTLIGETLDDGNSVVGCVLGRRRSLVKIAVWTRNKDDVEANMVIGERMRKVLQLAPGVPVEYYSHSDVNNAATTIPLPILKA